MIPYWFATVFIIGIASCGIVVGSVVVDNANRAIRPNGTVAMAATSHIQSVLPARENVEFGLSNLKFQNVHVKKIWNAKVSELVTCQSRPIGEFATFDTENRIIGSGIMVSSIGNAPFLALENGELDHLDMNHHSLQHVSYLNGKSVSSFVTCTNPMAGHLATLNNQSLQVVPIRACDLVVCHDESPIEDHIMVFHNNSLYTSHITTNELMSGKLNDDYLPVFGENRTLVNSNMKVKELMDNDPQLVPLDEPRFKAVIAPAIISERSHLYATCDFNGTFVYSGPSKQIFRLENWTAQLSEDFNISNDGAVTYTGQHPIWVNAECNLTFTLDSESVCGLGFVVNDSEPSFVLIGGSQTQMESSPNICISRRLFVRPEDTIRLMVTNPQPTTMFVSNAKVQIQ